MNQEWSQPAILPVLGTAAVSAVFAFWYVLPAIQRRGRHAAVGFLPAQPGAYPWVKD